jgi:16S rRNA processing protein RimM
VSRPKLFSVGRITRPHGVRGEVKVFEDPGSTGAGVRGSGHNALLSLVGIGSREDAQRLANLELFVQADQLPPLPEGGHYTGELLGLRVEDVNGRMLGRLVQIFDNGAHDIYVVQQGLREILIPVHGKVLREVDVPGGRLVLDPPPGLPGLEEP